MAAYSPGSSLPSTPTGSGPSSGNAPTDGNVAAALPTYPMPAYLCFTPGGLSYCPQGKDGGPASTSEHVYSLSSFCQGSSSSGTPRSRRSLQLGGGDPPHVLIQKAQNADDALRQLSLLYSGARDSSSVPYFVPSLSSLANAAFGRLTGVPATAAKLWADSMVLTYLADSRPSEIRLSEEDVLAGLQTPLSGNDSNNNFSIGERTTTQVLKDLLQQAEAEQQANRDGVFRPRPCGYVFKRGDIAWNCRTCQTDSTCVICDNCFKNSNHEGHEVFFHRTTPGGCCDCGDAEAWKLQGCCDAHRPKGQDIVESSGDDPDEAVRMAQKGRVQGIETLQHAPTALPPKLAAALGAVIGAAVNCLVQAVDGAGIGADPAQWKLRWMDEASRIWNSAARNEDYYTLDGGNGNGSVYNEPKLPGSVATPSAFWGGPSDDAVKPLPQNYRLHLRLHNDDVHTFEEVIDALHDSRHTRRSLGSDDPPLVTLREAANEMTHHVDADGQVSVKAYSSLHSAVQGFRRLKSRGLHCAVVSTAQTDMEHRARALSSWLSEISAAHPAAAVLVVHALVQAGRPTELVGTAVWQEARTIPAWAMTEPLLDVHALRRRFTAFPPHLSSSYLTSEEAEKLYDMATTLNATQFRDMTGKPASFCLRGSFFVGHHLIFVSPRHLRCTTKLLFRNSIPAATGEISKVAPCTMGHITIHIH